MLHWFPNNVDEKKPAIKQPSPAVVPTMVEASDKVWLTPHEKNRLRVACAAATGVMLTVGPEDPLTIQLLNVARALLPKGWKLPGWHDKRMYWLDTVANKTTWKLPDREAGQTK